MNHFALILVLQMAFFVQPVCVVAQLNPVVTPRSVIDGKQAQPVTAVIPKTKAEQQTFIIRKRRLEAHFAVFAVWVDYHCELSPKQKIELNKIIAELIEKTPRSFDAIQGNVYSRQYLYDYSPVRFVDTQGAARGIYHAGLEKRLLEILNAEQKNKWLSAITKRKQALHEIFLERVTDITNRKLPLTTKQKQQLKKIFPDHLPLLENGLYSFKPRNQYVHEKSILTILTQPPMAYRREQWESLKLIRQNRVQRIRRTRTKNIQLMAIDGPEGWRKTINTEAEEFQDELQLFLQKQSLKQFLGNQLSPENLRYLEVARKGAAVRTVKEWKKKSLLATVQYERIIEQRPGINFGFSVPGIDSSKIDQHPLWENAVKKVKASLQGQGQGESSELTIKYAVAMLDQELWLTSKQQQKMNKLYQDSHLANELLYRGDQYELYLLSTIIYAKKESEMESILSKQQFTAFKTLKKQYEIEDSFLRFFKSDR